MRERLERLLDRYGQTVTVAPRGGEEPVEAKAFLQPLRKNREDLPIVPSPLGAVSRQRWLYIGRGCLPLSPGDAVEWKGMALVAQETQEVAIGDEILYLRAVLRPEKEERE